MIFLIYKNRGILIPVFLIVPAIGFLILSGELGRNFGGYFATESFKQIMIGIGFLISFIWTYLTSEDFIIVDGKKEKIEMFNHFFYIPNKTWSYIMLGFGILVIIGGLLEFFS
ncbi:hypothetical protein [Flavobacterium sp.]|uniref:hypothetical protein n=1 Tax=Flavobacterium sp. TaxID=239 RepID=UPI003D26C16D